MPQAKVTFRANNPKAIEKIAKSGELLLALEPTADAIFRAAQQDPNEAFVRSLRKKMFVSSGRKGRVSWQIGAHPVIGARVEAKRGVFQRILARMGF